jgi:hypothetical protein
VRWLLRRGLGLTVLFDNLWMKELCRLAAEEIS